LGCESLNILIAEDDYVICQEVKRILTKLGHNVIAEVSNGIDAVTRTIELEPDIVIMDIKMPKLDGLEATKRVQGKKSTPVVILSAYDDEDLARRAADAGASAFLVKPAADKQFQRAIIIAMARHDDLMRTIQLNKELSQALEEIKTLRGIVPICMHCKGIRDDKGYWKQLEEYLMAHTDAEFSHGICPQCYDKLYSHLDKKQL